ncbi:MAG: phosphate-starvation-inducible PsiE family protein [Nitrospiraceae bacterium]|nr:phosphate-starvation-inducible PsiE family protein [Nitrospiraceae bacterium]
MRTFKEIKHDYRFTPEDERRLASLRPLMEEQAAEIMSTLSLWFQGTKGAARFFDENTLKKHIVEQKEWFLLLFSGVYDNRYYERMIGIGMAHVRRSVDVHFMHRVANIIKNSCIGVLSKMDEPREEIISNIISLGKIVDITLDVITTSYIEEEMRIYSPVYKVKSALINFSEKFSQTTNFMLVFALIGLTLGVVWLFIQDVLHLFAGDLERGIISSLGSMLLLWLMIELMSTEISHLKGGKFHISVFVGVALVTMIRETMIATLRHEKPESIYYLIAAILVVGFVYWIVTKAEERQR